MRHKRWVATAWYRTEAGLVDVEHQIDELEELQALIERGPDWHTLDRIEVRLGSNATPDLPIEAAAGL